MKRKKYGWFADILLCGAALFLFIGSLFWFHACGPKEDGSFMVCHWAGRAVSASSALVVILSLMLLAAREESAKAALAAAVLPAAGLTMLFPGALIHLCMMPEMRCRSLMRPAVLVTGAVILLLAAWSTAVHLKRTKESV